MLCCAGPPGCGKGTQAPKLKSEHCLCHIATGDLLRAAVAAKTPLGSEVDTLSDDPIKLIARQQCFRFRCWGPTKLAWPAAEMETSAKDFGHAPMVGHIFWLSCSARRASHMLSLSQPLSRLVHVRKLLQGPLLLTPGIAAFHLTESCQALTSLSRDCFGLCCSQRWNVVHGALSTLRWVQELTNTQFSLGPKVIDLSSPLHPDALPPVPCSTASEQEHGFMKAERRFVCAAITSRLDVVGMCQ